MDAGIANEVLESKYTYWLVGALAIVLFLGTNLPWQLDDYDQAKQAFTSFEMTREGDWLYQKTPHERVATKPPLIGWISSGIFAMTRSWDAAWRLPSLLAAFAIFIILHRAATSAHGPAAGVIASSAFAFNLLTPRLATLVRTDMPLALVIFLIGLLIWQKARQSESWSTRDRLTMFVLLTAAMLIKGPIVYAFLVPGIVAFEFCRRGRGAQLEWSGWWPWLLSLLIFLLWVTGGSIFVPGFYNQVVVQEFLGRFGETLHRPQPFLFYLPHLLHKFFPWSVLMIVLGIIDLRSRQWRIRPASLKIQPEALWLVCWIFGGLIVMSIIPSKRVDRIFPIIPPLCLLLAAQIGWKKPRSHGSASRSSESSDVKLADYGISQRFGVAGNEVVTGNEKAHWRFRLSAAALLISILFTSSYAVAKVASGYRDHRDALVAFGRAVRDQAVKHRWRFEVVKSNDEGLLLYLEKTHFIAADRAVTEWNRGNLDAVIAPAADAPDLMRQLHDAALCRLKSAPRKDEANNYLLIAR